MSCEPVSLTIYRGLDFGPVIITCRQGTQGGPALDLTGWMARAEIRKGPGQQVILDLAPSLQDAAAGEIQIALSKEQTAALPLGGYQWDLILTRPDGTTLSAPTVAGPVSIHSPITQPA